MLLLAMMHNHFHTLMLLLIPLQELLKYFTTLDLASGYWQVAVEENGKEKTAFSTSKAHFEFDVMQFDLTNAPAAFQRLMECVLVGLVERSV